MLFNSPVFLFIFLPISLLGFYFLGKIKATYSILFLVIMSFTFYGWWNPVYLYLLIFSIIFNFIVGGMLYRYSHSRHNSNNVAFVSTILLVFGVLVNLSLIGYFKYYNFFISSINYLFKSDWNLENIILPLAISFFTFQQITYLVDSYKGLSGEYNFLRYMLFVTFFPQLIAGPIVHHAEMMPQFNNKKKYLFEHRNFSIGIVIFILGLFKKVVIADNVALYATPVFSAANDGHMLTFVEAWGGALAYSFQLYFDFSGYSDMAIGLARMFSIKLPMNFNSPYKAGNIIDFWRRWHMTLSRFLRDYLYIPLGGNRHGNKRRYAYIMITMLLGGLWHGAGWTFVTWGGLHGIFLIINHTWHKYKKTYFNKSYDIQLLKRFSVFLTFFVVVIAWVPFRAEDFRITLEFFHAMSGANGFILPSYYQNMLGPFAPALEHIGWRFNADPTTFIFDGIEEAVLLIFLYLIVTRMPNTQQIMGEYEPTIEFSKQTSQTNSDRLLIWQPNIKTAVLTAFLAVACFLSLEKISEFLYFQF